MLRMLVMDELWVNGWGKASMCDHDSERSCGNSNIIGCSFQKIIQATFELIFGKKGVFANAGPIQNFPKR